MGVGGRMKKRRSRRKGRWRRRYLKKNKIKEEKIYFSLALASPTQCNGKRTRGMGRRQGKEGNATCLMMGLWMLLFYNLHHGLGTKKKTHQ